MRILISGLLLALAAHPALSGTFSPSPAGAKTASSPTILREPHPLIFEANKGQFDSQIRFACHAPSYTIACKPEEVTIRLLGAPSRSPATNDKQPPSDLHVRLIGAHQAAQWTGETALASKMNYFIGKIPATWRTAVPTYARVRAKDAYPGIDLTYYGSQAQIEFDFDLAPGKRVDTIALRMDGAQTKKVDASGNLILTVGGREMQWRRPAIYQTIAGRRKLVSGQYALRSNGLVGFNIGTYDHTKPLTIDPQIIYSTYLGGRGTDYGHGVAVDPAGNVYVAGTTSSDDFLTTPGAGQRQIAYDSDGDTKSHVFITKFSAAGYLLYSTYLSGENFEEFGALAVDAAGNAYVSGITGSEDFPTTPTAYQARRNHFDANAFLTVITPQGSALQYSTYIHGSGVQPQCMALSADGHAFIGGEVTAYNFTTTPSAFQAKANTVDEFAADAFLMEFDPRKSGEASLLYSTVLRAANPSIVNGVAVDLPGRAYLAGYTRGSDFPTTENAFQRQFLAQGNNPVSHQPQGSAFACVIDTRLAGTASLVYSTFLGGAGDSGARAIAGDSAGDIYVTGWATQGFPTTPGAPQTKYGGDKGGVFLGDAFVAKLDTRKDGAAGLIYSTYLGGDNDDQGFSVTVDASGRAYAAGLTGSSNFPVTPGAITKTTPTQAAFVAALNSDGRSLEYSTLLGGSNTTAAFGASMDVSGQLFITGFTAAQDFPVTPQAIQDRRGVANDFDAFLTVFKMR